MKETLENKHQSSAKNLNIANPQNEQIGSELWWLMVLILVSSPVQQWRYTQLSPIHCSFNVGTEA